MTLTLALLFAAAAPAPAVSTPLWDDVPDELARAAEGGVDACEVAALPVSIVPGIGDVASTVAEWACLAPAAIAVDTVAVQFGGRDDSLWQAGLAVLLQKLFEDAIDVPFDLLLGAAVVGAVGTLVGSALVASFLVPGFPIFLPTLVAVVAGTFLVAPVALLEHAGGEWVFEAVFMALTSRLYDGALDEKRTSTLLKPGAVGQARSLVLMTAAAASDPEPSATHFLPIAGPLFKAADEARYTKERMRRVGRDMLRDAPGRDLGAMDATIDALAVAKGATGALGEGLAAAGLGVGLTGAALPPLKLTDQRTGDVVGFTGLGIALAGLGLYALSESLDTVKTVAVPLAYGAFE